MPVATPKILGPPQSTPLSTRGTLRAPIHNPYDKFSQPEFDAWIGDITSALKRALGQEEQPAPPPISESLSGDISAYVEDVAEDSFAEIKARRAAKGKQRATYEDQEDDEELEVESSILLQDVGEGEDEEDVESNDDSPYSWYNKRSQWGSQEDEQADEDADNDASGEEDGASFVDDADEPIEISSDEEDTTEQLSSPQKAPYEPNDAYEGDKDEEDTFEDGDEHEATPSRQFQRYDEEEDELEGESPFGSHMQSDTNQCKEFVPSDIDSVHGSSPVEVHGIWQGSDAYGDEEDVVEEPLGVSAEDPQSGCTT